MKWFGAACSVTIVLAALPLIAWGQAPASRKRRCKRLWLRGSPRYQQLHQWLAVGWNTWDVRV